jgi:hypothetical protein
MKAYTVIAAIALTAIVFASPLMASNSVNISTEKGYMDHNVRGYFGETTVPSAGIEQSIGQSRENGGSQPALNSAKGLGLGTGTSVEQSTEKGVRW